VGITMAANTGPARTGALTVAGRTITIAQASGCSVTINPTTFTAPASGAAGAITVSTASGCQWSAASGSSWITVSTASTGTGPDRVEFAVAANTGPERAGSLTVGGRTFTVTQLSGCRYDISPSSHDAPPLGDTTAVTVSTAAACPWSATTSVPWVAPSIAAASGAGQVQLVVAPNPGPMRAGGVTIAGHTFTINQASQCTFMLNPTSSSYDANGGEGLVLVFLTGQCTWDATSALDWIRIKPEYSGSTGSAFVRFTVSPNGGSARSGTVVIAGVAHGVTQGGR
jgi:hypothetical protein